MTAAHGLVLGRTRRRAIVSRVSTGHVVMVLAGLLGALLTLNVLRTADNTRPVLVAAHDLPPGAVIDAGSMRVTRVHVDESVYATLLSASALDHLRGEVTVARVARGALVTRDAVRATSSGAAPRAMSFPIPVTRAVDGTLVAGDHVDVLAIEHDNGRGGYVATNVEVLAFTSHAGGPLQAGDDASVTIAVDSAAAARIAAALEVGTVTLVRATGAQPSRAALFDPTSPVPTATGASKP